MPTSPTIKHLMSSIQEFGPHVAPIIFFLLKRLFQTKWINEKESEELIEKMRDNPDEAAEMIENHNDSEEIEQNLERLCRELDACNKEDVENADKPEELASEIPTLQDFV